MREELGLGTSAFAQLSPHFRGFRAISDVGGTTCWCANMKMHLHNITCNFLSFYDILYIYSTLLSQAFAREHYYKLFRKSFAASISAFAEPSDIYYSIHECFSSLLRIVPKVGKPTTAWFLASNWNNIPLATKC